MLTLYKCNGILTITSKKVGNGTYTLMYSTDKYFRNFKEVKNTKNKFVLKMKNKRSYQKNQKI